jgi:hypothetical protein
LPGIAACRSGSRYAAVGNLVLRQLDAQGVDDCSRARLSGLESRQHLVV